MKFYSTNHQSKPVSFRNAVLNGIANDGGLYYPERVPQLSASFFKQLPKLSLSEIGYHFLKPYVGDELSDLELQSLLNDALDFDVPLVRIREDEYVLELFHGPTLAFKDVGARTMARFLSRFSGDQKTTILVATSGDTGGAVAHGFYGLSNIDVVILYPKAKVSEIQEKQFATLGNNIVALEVEGTFDDCQRLVKEAFADDDLNRVLTLSSANSINIARLLPQAIYYFYAYSRLGNISKPVVFSVPSGNYGNLTAGLLAKKSGLPVSRFIAAANRNDVVPEYLHTGVFSPRPSVMTISNAMDVGNPSNFARMLEMYGQSHDKMESDIQGYSFSDDQTGQHILQYFKETGYLLDPHGAVASLGLDAYKEDQEVTGIFLETAHPAKFMSVYEDNLRKKIAVPARLEKNMGKTKRSLPMSNVFNDLKDWLLNRR